MEEDLKLWKRVARSYQQSCCNGLGDRMYDHVTSEELEWKVGYALYNSPTDVDEVTKTAKYTKAQTNHIKLICDQVKTLQTSSDGSFYISYVYVVIRLDKKSQIDVAVLFRVPKLADEKRFDSHMFIDSKPRLYDSWEGFLRKNKLPKCHMCYPTNGIYSEKDGIVNIQFGRSPACDTSTAVFKGLDISSTVCLVGATGVALASLAVPIATPVIWGAAATVFASGTYETGRNVYRLHDMKKHRESLGLKNPDSRSAWLSLAGSVVGMASIGATAIARGVVATESAISRAGILTLRILNASSLGVSGIGVVNSIITVVMKKINGALEFVDVLELISACLYFLNAIVSYELANRLIEELACSDLTNLFNLRENASYRVIKDVIQVKDRSTYDILRQLVMGVQSQFMPDIKLDDIESAILEIVSLLARKDSGSINNEKLCLEIALIMQRIWKRYQNVIMKVFERIRKTFEITDWQHAFPYKCRSNLEIPRQMCDEVDRVREICGINDQSEEQRSLMTFARAFSAPHSSTTNKEFLNRTKFYCDCIISQYKEEREMYENELDSKSSETNFNGEEFDKNYGIVGNKSRHFFVKALDKVNHPDFLGNIDELYENLPRTEECNPQLAYLESNKSTVYTFCGPFGEKQMPENFYWETAEALTGLSISRTNCDMTELETKGKPIFGQKKGKEVDEDRIDKLILIVPKKEVVDANGKKLTEIEAISIHTSFIDNCHIGLLILIHK